MRLVLFLVIAASAGMVAIFLMAPTDPITPKDLEREEDAQPRARGQGGPGFDASAVSGEAVFSPWTETVQLGPVALEYPALLFHAERTHPETGRGYALDGVRVLWNPEPRSQEEAERLTRVPKGTSARSIGGILDQAIGSVAPGLHAKSCRFIGGTDLGSARSIDFEGPVSIDLLDPADTNRKARLVTGSLTGTIENRKLTSLTTDGAVEFTSDQGQLTGEGLLLDVATGQFTLQRKIVGRLDKLNFLGGRSATRQTEPLRLRGEGPLTYTPWNPKEDRAQRNLFGRFDLIGGFHMRQGQRTLKGDRLQIERDPAGFLRAVTLDGSLAADSEWGSISAAHGRWERSGAEGRGSLVFSEGETEVTLKGAGSWLPLTATGEHLVLTTRSPFSWEGLSDTSTERQFLKAGPGLTITSGEVQVEAGHMLVELGNLPRVHQSPGMEPVAVRLSEGVQGKAPDGSFSGSLLHAQRTWLQDGTPDRERISLEGDPAFELLNLGLAASTTADGAGELVGGLLGSDGRTTIGARNQLLLERDPLRRRPLRLTAMEGVEVRRFGTENVLKVSLDTGFLKLRITEYRSIDDAGVIEVSRKLDHAFAEGGVLLKTGEGAELAGMALTFDAPRAFMSLTKGSDLAVIRKSTQEVARAELIEVHLDQRRMEARGRAQVEAPIDALPIDMLFGIAAQRIGVPLRTTMTAEVISMSFMPEDPVLARHEPLKTRWKARVIEAKDQEGFVIDQGEAVTIKGQSLRFDLPGRTGQLTGAPVKVDVVREGGERDQLETADISILNEQAMLAGPLSGTFHVARSRMALDLAAFSGPTEGLAPLSFSAQEGAFISRARASLRGSVDLRFGQQPDSQSSTLKANRTFLLFAPEGVVQPLPSAGSTTVYRVIAEGAVDFQSPKLNGAGDVMEFDAWKRVLTLYRTEGDAKLSRPGELTLEYKCFLVDFTDPDNPLVSWLRRIPR